METQVIKRNYAQTDCICTNLRPVQRAAEWWSSAQDYNWNTSPGTR